MLSVRVSMQCLKNHIIAHVAANVIVVKKDHCCRCCCCCYCCFPVDLVSVWLTYISEHPTGYAVTRPQSINDTTALTHLVGFWSLVNPVKDWVQRWIFILVSGKVSSSTTVTSPLRFKHWLIQISASLIFEKKDFPSLRKTWFSMICFL